MIAKGEIKAISQKEKGYGININDVWYNGYGKCPYTKGQVVEFEWEPKTSDDGRTWNTIKQPSKTEKVIEDKVTPKIDEIIKYLAMPHVTISVEKTISEAPYEPRKMAIHIKTPIENITQTKLTALMDMAIAEIEDRIIELKKQDTKPTPQEYFKKEVNVDAEGLEKQFEKYDQEAKKKEMENE